MATGQDHKGRDKGCTVIVYLSNLMWWVILQDPVRIQEMKYAEKVEHSTAKIGARFIDYQPETGSWIFEVMFVLYTLCVCEL